MRFGLSPIQSQKRFDAMLRQAGLAESLGYDVLWAHKHHAGAMMYPSPLMTARSLSQIGADHFSIGEPAECIDGIARYAALGIKEFASLVNFGAPQEAAVERSMRLFTERVMPHVSTL